MYHIACNGNHTVLSRGVLVVSTYLAGVYNVPKQPRTADTVGNAIGHPLFLFVTLT